MESFKTFKVGDIVQIYKRIIGTITWVDYKNDEADVEWEDSSLPYPNIVSVPFKFIEFVED